MKNDKKKSDNLIDTSRYANRIEKEKRQRELELSDIRFILKTPEGRRFYWRLLAYTGMFRNPFTDSDSRTNFNCGRQSVGQELLNRLMEAKPNAYGQMQEEFYSKMVSDNIIEEMEREKETLI